MYCISDKVDTQAFILLLVCCSFSNSAFNNNNNDDRKTLTLQGLARGGVRRVVGNSGRVSSAQLVLGVVVTSQLCSSSAMSYAYLFKYIIIGDTGE